MQHPWPKIENFSKLAFLHYVHVTASVVCIHFTYFFWSAVVCLTCRQAFAAEKLCAKNWSCGSCWVEKISMWKVKYDSSPNLEKFSAFCPGKKNTIFLLYIMQINDILKRNNINKNNLLCQSERCNCTKTCKVVWVHCTSV